MVIDTFYDNLKLITKAEKELSKMSNEELVRCYQNGNKVALDVLIAKNLGIVRKFANKYKKVALTNVTEEDLLQEGYLALTVSANRYRFDMEKKAKFITFAIHYVNRFMHIAVNGHTLKQQENQNLYKETVSLNTPVSEESEDELIEFVEDKSNQVADFIEAEFLQQVHRELEEIMYEKLTLREREVLKMLYGWNMGKCNNVQVFTLVEVAEVFGVSKTCIDITKNNALNKIRRTTWWKEVGMAYARELKGLVFLCEEDKDMTYASVESNNPSSETVKTHNYINKYFADLLEEAIC